METDAMIICIEEALHTQNNLVDLHDKKGDDDIRFQKLIKISHNHYKHQKWPSLTFGLLF